MKALIIEDEKLTADRLNKMVAEHTSIRILNTFYSVNSATQWLQDNDCPDLIFLDIQLGDGTGFDILETLETFPQVIFTTAFDKYVLDAFKYNSVDYLLKPVQAEKLVKAIDKLEKVRSQEDFSKVIKNLKTQLSSPYKQKFLVKTGLKYASIHVQDIAYFYSESSTTYLQTYSGESMIVDHSLDELEGLMDPACFFRVNRHIMLCDKSITSIDSYFNNRLMVSVKPQYNENIIVSREKVRSFKSWLDS
ncbi:LytR/AlgR family response regulator transcription factor [Ekhidna sp. To15]|uniref:LytR/AlgR family response regulator transcription factor n=1 Tax=Ekhidna sp. To15 TaxID=3395267 RepID=UPI003F5282CD